MGRYKGKRPRKFQGNQYVVKKPKLDQQTGAREAGEGTVDDCGAPRADLDTSASGRKIPSEVVTSTFGTERKMTGFRLMDVDLLNEFIANLCCPECQECNLKCVAETQRGCQSTLRYQCQCGYSQVLETSKKVPNGGHEVNGRFTQGILAIGKNRTAAETLLMHLNMPPPVSVNAWEQYSDRIHSALENVAKKSMAKAGEELKKDGCDVAVSVDGTWQRRGFSSKNGVVTCVSVANDLTCKVIDVELLTSHCQACALAKNRMSDEELKEWMARHQSDCTSNHDGSAGSMEPKGALAIFRRSEETHGLRYTSFLGDGDSKSFKMVSEAVPPVYNENEIKKLECVGHIQKRMTNHLMKKVSECKNKQFTTDEGKKVKGIGGQKRLSKCAIARIQGHYGAAIRGHKGDLSGMKKAVWAIYFHRRGEHEMCGTWCTKDEKANKHSLPSYIMDEIKPVFRSLAAPDLLKKCLHGGTQNTNESLHNIIWTKCPKEVYVGRKRLEIGLNEAVVQYNDGETGKVEVYNQLYLGTGYYTFRGMIRRDRRRVLSSLAASSHKTKQKRKDKSLQKKADEADYNPGGF